MINERNSHREAILETKLRTHQISLLAPLALSAATLLISTPAFGVDAAAAQALARQNNCFKCHAVDKAKDGPAWKDVAKKLKGDKDAEAKLIKHLTTGPKVKASDGSEEEHPIIKAKSADDTKNLADWILSL